MDYRQILKEKYQQRRGRNSGYSLRAYARDLGLSAPRLNEVLAGKKGISPEIAPAVARALKLEPHEEALFTLSVAALHSRSAMARKAAAEKLREETERADREPPRHSTVVFWTTEAVHKLTSRAGFEATPEFIAAALGVPLSMASAPLRFLTRAGLLPGIPKERAYIADRLKGKRLNVDYEQILELARKAFLGSRESSTEIFDHEPLLIEPEDLPKARALLDRTRREIRKMESTSRRARLHYLAFQFFQIEHERNKP